MLAGAENLIQPILQHSRSDGLKEQHNNEKKLLDK